MKTINRYLSLIGIAILAVSCVKERDGAYLEGEGAMVLDFSFEQATKSVMPQSELENTSIVNIYKKDLSGLVRSFTYAERPQKIYLSADEYRVDIIAGEASKPRPDKANWEQKSYKGQAYFTITPGKDVNVEVVAKVNNVISLVKFDTSTDDIFQEGYTFRIGLDPQDDTKNLVYNHKKSGDEGYFIADALENTLYWSFSGVLKKTGETVVKSGEIEDVAPGFIYKLSPKYTVRDADLILDLKVDEYVSKVNDLIVFNPVSTGISATPLYEIWASRTTFFATVDEDEYSDPEKLTFKYIPEDEYVEEPEPGQELQWVEVPALRIEEGEYSAKVSGLKPSTTYLYKLLYDGNMLGEMASLTTAEAKQFPNFGFETISNAESNNYVSFFNPSSEDPTLKTKFWDSGSSASSMLGNGYAICYSDSDVPEGIGSTRSARLQSKYVVIKFAAGNLFAGNYVETNLLTQVGTVDFGRYWNSRPSHIRLWYKYNGGAVDYPADKFTKGDPDIFSIQVAIGTWSNKKYKGASQESPLRVKTDDEGTFWDYALMDETVAYVKFEESAIDNNKEWRQVTLPFHYKTKSVIPTNIVVNCAASKYGDYFAGSSTSALYIDHFELLYE